MQAEGTHTARGSWTCGGASSSQVSAARRFGRSRRTRNSASAPASAIYQFRYFAESGGLMAYGSGSIENYRHAASYVDRILKGEKAADLPVQLPTKYNLVINLKTAQGARPGNSRQAARARRRGDRMRRRAFLTLLGGAAAWPFAARAQQARRIGMLIGYAEKDAETQARLAAFRKGLDRLGWAEDRNVLIDYRFAPANLDQAQQFARELVARRPEVLVGNSTPATAALLRETHSIPIVFVGVSDPLGSGFVASIARPGGNVTGFTNFEPSLTGKLIELLKEVAPGIARVAAIFNPKTAPGGGSFFLSAFDPVARSLGVTPITHGVGNATELENLITAIGREPGGSLLVMPDAFGTVHRQLIILLAARHGLPAISPIATRRPTAD
jgi:putative tryptophan/tyrosine transport system substrate-binding protein